MKRSFPREAQWVMTYQCELNRVSKYCSLGSHGREEASLQEKLAAIKILEAIGVKTLKLLGGEFFDQSGAEEILGALNASGLDFVITTNALAERRILAFAGSALFKPGSGLFFSLDFLDKRFTAGGCSTVKTLAAIELIPKLAELPFPPLLGVNTVIHNKNLGELPGILRWITGYNGYMNICPLIWGDWQKFIYRAPGKDMALGPEHRRCVAETMNVLSALKRQGCNLACSQRYVRGLADACCGGERFAWDCGSLKRLPLLRVDSDLSLMVCSDIRGEDVSKFRLDDLLDERHRAGFIEAWLNDADRTYCAENFGCYWSNMLRAVENFSNGGSFIK
ncbi:MAG: radical SAM protein [Candidatus Pacebacteria bacterium]|nr:radical SAM protein [Candidatus Paceibacterota bacterium]